MANSLVQFRYEYINKVKATSICERLGIDLQTYLRMLLNRLIQENGVPFSMTLDSDNFDNGDMNEEITEEVRNCVETHQSSGRHIDERLYHQLLAELKD